MNQSYVNLKSLDVPADEALLLSVLSAIEKVSYRGKGESSSQPSIARIYLYHPAYSMYSGRTNKSVSCLFRLMLSL